MEQVKDFKKLPDYTQAKMLYALMRIELPKKELNFYDKHFRMTGNEFVETKDGLGLQMPKSLFSFSFKDKDNFAWKDILKAMHSDSFIGWQFICALDKDDINRAQLMYVPMPIPFTFQIFLGEPSGKNKILVNSGASLSDSTDEIREEVWKLWQAKYEEIIL